MTAPDAPAHEARETMWFAPDQKSAAGRWYWGAYEEFGFDVKLTRATAEPTIASVTPDAVKVGTAGAELHIIGDKLPTSWPCRTSRWARASWRKDRRPAPMRSC
jgi:quinohemoprotein amine dehydrogenase